MKRSQLGATFLRRIGILFFIVTYFFSGASSVQADYLMSDESSYNERFLGLAAVDYFGDNPLVGDYNGDGVQDISIGAIDSDFYGVDTGWYGIFWGGDNMSESPDLVLHEGTTTGRFGSPAQSGDLNADGVDDLVISAPRDDTAYTDAGSIYVYMGGDQIDNTPEIVFAGSDESEFLGNTLPEIADVNGDGDLDLIIGNGFHSGSDYRTGRVDVYYGGEEFDESADLSIEGTVSSQWLGVGIYTADINNDNVNDLFVNSTGTDEIFIYLGGESIDNTVDFILEGGQASEYFGGAFSSSSIRVGYVDSDENPDILVGARGYDIGEMTSAGRIYFFSGGPDLDGAYDFTIEGSSAGTFLGSSITLSDVTGDGFDDLLITDFPSNIIEIIYGGMDFHSTPDKIIPYPDPGSYAGVRDFGDFNADGINDIFVGAHYADVDGANNIGQAYVYFGGADIDEDPDVVFTGASAGDEFNASGGCGDVNADGVEDMIFVAMRNDLVGGQAGAAYLVYSFPHSISVQSDLSSIMSIASFTVSGTVDASDSISNISKVQYSVNDDSHFGNWQDCNSTDGQFDQKTEGFSCNIANLQDGVYDIYIRARDSNMFYTAGVSYWNDTFTVDTTSPEVDIEINDGFSVTTTREVELAIRPQKKDFTGIVEMMICNDKDFDDCNWEEYDTHIDWKLTSGEGKKKVYAQFKDAAGNISERSDDSIVYRVLAVEDRGIEEVEKQLDSMLYVDLTEYSYNESSKSYSPPLGNSIIVKGDAEPGSGITVAIVDNSRSVVYDGETVTDEFGSWRIEVPESYISDGSYEVKVESQTEAGDIESSNFLMEVMGISKDGSDTERPLETDIESSEGGEDQKRLIFSGRCVFGILAVLLVIGVILVIAKKKNSSR
ncbi:hypothetical protein GF357_04215 [Candidatus Dojkabacteria bacterium]|nr:hypothetical protein [Candidatus Dojkabacteria bacterium]